MEKKRAVHKLEDNAYLNTKFSWLLRWSLPQDPGFLSSLVALGPEISHISVIKNRRKKKVWTCKAEKNVVKTIAI